MKKYFVFLLSFIVCGCVTMTASEEDLTSEKRIHLVNFNGLQKGMTSQEVLSVLKKNSFLGYEIKEGSTTFSAIEIQGPYRQETLEKTGHVYTVLYYLNSILQPDGIVADDELMPLIFKDDQLVDKGWDALFKLKNK